MLGVYDFNGHYDWTFAWLEDLGGQAALDDYWDVAISQDSQIHARQQFQRGLAGMVDYWGHTLAEEGAGYTSEVTRNPRTGRKLMRIDMHACPSMGFLVHNGIGFSSDYCNHCVGWIGPALTEAGFELDHEHDHAAHCWWEIRESSDHTPPTEAGELAAADVRLLPTWSAQSVHCYRRSQGPVTTDAPTGQDVPNNGQEDAGMMKCDDC